MYLYFDKTGTLKEIINNEAIRQGNLNYNKVYCYFEDGIDFSSGLFWKLKYPDGTESNDVSFLGTQYEEIGQIPYNKDVDYKYFKDFVTYNFHVFNLTSYLSQDGLYKLTITAYPTQSIANVLGTVTFNAESSVIESDPQLTQSQYSYLLGLIGEWIDTIDDKVSKKSVDEKGTIYNDNTNKVYLERKTNDENYYTYISLLGNLLKAITRSTSGILNSGLEVEPNSVVLSSSNSGVAYVLKVEYDKLTVNKNVGGVVTESLLLINASGIYYKGNDLLTEVNTGDIVDKAVTKAKLSQELQDFLNDIVASIPDGSVTTPKIVNGAVTKEKLATALATQIDGAGRKLALEIDTDFKIVAKLYDKDDNLISTSNAIDLPLESVVVSGAYDSQTQKVVLTLQDGSTIEFSVADLVSGLQPEITSSNKLAVNLVAFSQAQLDALNSGITAAKVSGYDSHLSNTNNPHSVTKAQVGLGNVDNTSDANKPVSTAQQAALNLKEDKANKVNSISSASTDDKYPSAKAVYDGIQNYGGAVGVNKALYHLGAYDSADGKIRQTGYAVLTADKILNISTSSHVTQSILVNFAVYTTNKPSSNDDIKNFTNSRGFASRSANDMWNNNVTGICEQMDDGKFTVRIKDVNDLATFVSYLPIYIEYQLATSYQDTPIENQSILPLDTNMANKIRQRIVDGLNLWTSKSWIANGPAGAGGSEFRSSELVAVKPNTTYTISFQALGQSSGYALFDIKGSMITSAESGYVSEITFTTTSTTYFIKLWFWKSGGASTPTWVMLNEGNHPYPYSDFNQKEHITNNEATLLKQEEEKSRNLYSGSQSIVGTASSYVDVPTNFALDVGTYTLSFNTNSPVPLIQLYNGSTLIASAYSSGSNLTISSNVNVTKARFWYNASSGAGGTFTYSNIMLNKGSQALPYHEYCGEILHEVDRPKLYRHFVKLYFGDSEYGFTGEVICDNPNALTFDDLKALYPTETKQLKLYPSDPSVDDAIGNTPSTGGADGAMIVSAYFNLYTENKVFACVVYVSNGKLVGEERVFYPSTQHGVDVRVAITDNVEDM